MTQNKNLQEHISNHNGISWRKCRIHTLVQIEWKIYVILTIKYKFFDSIYSFTYLYNKCSLEAENFSPLSLSIIDRGVQATWSKILFIPYFVKRWGKSWFALRWPLGRRLCLHPPTLLIVLFTAMCHVELVHQATADETCYVRIYIIKQVSHKYAKYAVWLICFAYWRNYKMPFVV